MMIREQLSGRGRWKALFPIFCFVTRLLLWSHVFPDLFQPAFRGTIILVIPGISKLATLEPESLSRSARCRWHLSGSVIQAHVCLDGRLESRLGTVFIFECPSGHHETKELLRWAIRLDAPEVASPWPRSAEWAYRCCATIGAIPGLLLGGPSIAASYPAIAAHQLLPFGPTRELSAFGKGCAL
jgi:hypothetical protein